LQQFTNTRGEVACLAPFLSVSCNHDYSCSLDCSNGACSTCGTTASESKCETDAFAANGTCRSYVNGNYCATAAFGGPGAFCDLQRIGDVGVWLQGVGAYYCSN
jgi:hypothetical protein